MPQFAVDEAPDSELVRIFGRKLDRDYGDVNVLAWHKSDRRVLNIECKDLQFRKTPVEMCEQVADFRGERGSDGKPDLLLKHFDPDGYPARERDRSGAYMKMVVAPSLESHLVFR